MRNPFPDLTDEAFLQNMVESINQYRAKHGAPPVELDPNLVEYAKSRASLASTEEGLSRGHEGLKDEYGENLSWQASSSQTSGSASGAASGWYGEIKDYDFVNSASKGDSVTGHFTQLVWKNSTKIGAGRAFGQGSKWWETYIAVNFYPAGNMEGEYQANVAPATS